MIHDTKAQNNLINDCFISLEKICHFLSTCASAIPTPAHILLYCKDYVQKGYVWRTIAHVWRTNDVREWGKRTVTSNGRSSSSSFRIYIVQLLFGLWFYSSNSNSRTNIVPRLEHGRLTSLFRRSWQTATLMDQATKGRRKGSEGNSSQS